MLKRMSRKCFYNDDELKEKIKDLKFKYSNEEKYKTTEDLNNELLSIEYKIMKYVDKNENSNRLCVISIIVAITIGIMPIISEYINVLMSMIMTEILLITIVIICSYYERQNYISDDKYIELCECKLIKRVIECEIESRKEEKSISINKANNKRINDVKKRKIKKKK